MVPVVAMQAALKKTASVTVKPNSFLAEEGAEQAQQVPTDTSAVFFLIILTSFWINGRVSYVLR